MRRQKINLPVNTAFAHQPPKQQPPAHQHKHPQGVAGGAPTPTRERPKHRLLRALVAVGIVAATGFLAATSLGLVSQPPRWLQDEPDAANNRYTGSWLAESNQFEGTVQVAFASGAFYSGGMVDQRMEGPGTYRKDDWQLEGTFVEGRLTGEGTYTDDAGTFTGTFVNSLPQGTGVYQSNAGWRYEGAFFGGAMTGTGTVTLADGTALTGTFEDGVLLKK